MPRVITAVVVAGLAVFLLMQAVPYGRAHANPPVIAEPAWDSPRTRELAVRACFDCHSNATVWPWYSNVAPLSWLVQRDVDKGRDELNFSEWGVRSWEGEDAAETVLDGSMPPRTYLLLHPQAALSAAERQELARGLAATLGQEAEAGDRAAGDEDRGQEDEDGD